LLNKTVGPTLLTVYVVATMMKVYEILAEEFLSARV
jgi:hypothetical protein